MISILLPVYNAMPYLKECLDSILAQDFPEWELLAVNDFSTDDSRVVLEEYAAKDSRIQVFSNTEKGIIPALRLAFSNSQFPYITRMDADDIMPTQKLGLLLQALQAKGTGYLATGFVQYFAKDGVQGGYQRYERWLNEIASQQIQYQEIYRECVIPSPCWMLHREDLIKCGAFEPMQYPEDYDLVFRFYRQQLKITVVPEVLHLWRDHSTRSSRTMEQYSRQEYFALKVPYFIALDWDKGRPLVLWGAGNKGKQIAKMLIERQVPFHWVCDNPRKEGKDIYGQRMENFQVLLQLPNPQVIIAVSNPEEQLKIRDYLSAQTWQAGSDFFFFV